MFWYCNKGHQFILMNTAEYFRNRQNQANSRPLLQAESFISCHWQTSSARWVHSTYKTPLFYRMLCLCSSVCVHMFGMKLFLWIFSATICIPSLSMHVSCFTTSHNLSLGCMVTQLIIKLLIILFHPVLLILSLFTSKCQSCNIFFLKDTQFSCSSM